MENRSLAPSSGQNEENPFVAILDYRILILKLPLLIGGIILLHVFNRLVLTNCFLFLFFYLFNGIYFSHNTRLRLESLFFSFSMIKKKHE